MHWLLKLSCGQLLTFSACRLACLVFLLCPEWSISQAEGSNATVETGAASNIVEIVLGVYGPINPFSMTMLATAVAFDLDFRKNFEPSLAERFGPPVVRIPNLNPNLRIKVQIGTSDSNPEIGMSTNLDFFLGRNGLAKVSCLVGGLKSAISMPVANLAAVFKIPQISFGSTSAKLSNKDVYPYFSRTVPSDSIQAAGMWQFIVHFQVPTVTFLYTREAYGEGLYGSVKSLASSVNASIRIRGIPVEHMRNYDANEARTKISYAKAVGNKILMIAFVSDQVRPFFSVMEEEGLFSAAWQIIASESSHGILDEGIPVGFMSFKPVCQGPLFPKFAEMWLKMTPADVTGEGAQTLYSLDKMKVPLEAVPEETLSSLSNLRSSDLFLFDAAYAFAIALSDLLNDNSSIANVEGERLLAKVRATNFEGITGRVVLDSRGDRSTSYTIENVQPDPDDESSTVWVPAAVFDAPTGQIVLDSENDLYWMDGMDGIKSSTLPESFVACERGHFLNARRVCHQCDTGTVSEGGMASACKICPSGRKADDSVSDCIECAPGRFSAAPASSVCTACPQNEYNPFPGARTCLRCPPGGVCTSNATYGAEMFEAAPGYYVLGTDNWSPRSTDQCGLNGFAGVGPLKCPVPSVCLGRNLCKVDAAGKQIMEGPLCGSCAVGYHRTGPLVACSECPPVGQNVVLLILVMIALILVSMGFDYLDVQAVGGELQLASMVLKVVSNFLVLFATISDNIRIYSFVDRMGTLSGLLRPVLVVAGIGHIVSEPSRRLYSMSCFLQEIHGTTVPEFSVVLVAWLGIPVMLLLLFFSVVIIRVLFAALCPRSVESVAFWFGREPLRTHFVSTSVVLTYFMHTIVTNQFLMVFRCVSEDEDTNLKYDYARLRQNLSVRCDGNSWQQAAGVGFVFWSIGIPLFFWYNLWLVRNTGGPNSLMEPRAKRMYGFLTDGYELEAYYYEAIVILRKVLLMVAECLPWEISSVARTIVLLMLMVGFLALHLQVQPYDNRAYFALDRLEQMSLQTVTCFLGGRAFEYVLASTAFSDISGIGYIPGIFALIYFFGLAIYLLLRNTIWPWDGRSPLLAVFYPSAAARLRVNPALTHKFSPRRVMDRQLTRILWTLDPLQENRASAEAEQAALGFGIGPLSFPSREVAVLKAFFAEVLSVLLARHIQVMGFAPEIISLQHLMLQMERLLTCCMCKALKNRVKHRMGLKPISVREILNGLAPKSSLRMNCAPSDSTELTPSDSRDEVPEEEEEPDWSNPECPLLKDKLDALREPVRMEELQLGFHGLMPRFLDHMENMDGESFLSSFAEDHRGLLDILARRPITPLFKPGVNLMRVTTTEWPEVPRETSRLTDMPVSNMPVTYYQTTVPPESPRVSPPFQRCSEATDSRQNNDGGIDDDPLILGKIVCDVDKGSRSHSRNSYNNAASFSPERDDRGLALPISRPIMHKEIQLSPRTPEEPIPLVLDSNPSDIERSESLMEA